MNYDKLTKEQLLGIHKDTLKYLNEQEQEIERLKREKDIVIKLNHFVSNEIKRILKDDDLCHIKKLQEIAKVVGVDKE